MESEKAKKANGLGNTNLAHRRFCFTLNNYNLEEKATLIDHFNKVKCNYIIGEEIGEKCETPHLQGYVEFKSNKNFSTLKNYNERIHWEVCKGSREQNIEYCSKENNYISTFPKPETDIHIEILNEEYKDITWKPWQSYILDILTSTPNRRTVYWFWETSGNVGKSFLVRYIFLYYFNNIILLEGKKDNIYNNILTWKNVKGNKNKTPLACIYDIPRSNHGHISYSGIESIKNGLFYSGKYEGGTVLLKPLHLICFSNEPPSFDELSNDRWIIKNINIDF